MNRRSLLQSAAAICTGFALQCFGVVEKVKVPENKLTLEMLDEIYEQLVADGASDCEQLPAFWWGQ